MAALKARLLAAKVRAQGIGKLAGEASRYMIQRIDRRILIASAAIFGGALWLWWRLWRIDPSIVVAAAVILGGGVAIWWWLPKLQADRLRLTIRDPKERADVEDNIRKTVSQLLAGAALLIGAGLAYLQFTQQQQTSQQQFLQQQRSSHELLISNQLAKGFEQLGSGNLFVRLGGIYALEGVMKTSEQYFVPVLDALSAFVRERTRTETGDGPPVIDVQAALTAIGRLKCCGSDLANVHIPKANLQSANLSGTALRGADLRDAMLFGADLHSADLRGADLSDAILTGADLSDAILEGANLSGARLDAATLDGARLYNANLSGADLSHAKVGLTLFWRSRVNLTGADLSGADLSETAISQTELDQACGTDAKLGSGLTLKPCPDN